MVHGVEAARAGLMMTPMMGCMLIVSTGIGFVVSRWGRYKIYPIIGTVIIGLALFFMSRMHPDDSAVIPIALLALLGLGIGLSMQLLVLIVQNSFPVSMVGTATASNNFFRQIGATLGMSVIGSVFTARLMTNLAESLPAKAKGAADASAQLTPAKAAELPAPIHDAVIASYNDALVPIFLWVVPLLTIAAAILLFIKEIPLATTVGKQGSTRTTLEDSSEVSSASSAGAR